MSDFEQITQRYKKKAEGVDERSTPEARAARARRLRNLANLTRAEMCEGGEMNPNTLKGWEIGRYGGLPLDGAYKIIKRVSEEGVVCTVEWLLYEDGPPPSVNVGQALEKHAQEDEESSEVSYLESELALFKKHYPAAMHVCIPDDGMCPFYEAGDVVAGIKKTGKQIEDVLETNCIVQLANGQMLCRRLRKGKSEHTYTLVCTNLETTVRPPILSEVEILSAASIVWHRKSEENFSKKAPPSTEKIIQEAGHQIRSPLAAIDMLLCNSQDLTKTDRSLLHTIQTSLNNISEKLLKKG